MRRTFPGRRPGATRPTRAAVVVACLLVSVVGAACGSGDDDDKASGATGTSTSIVGGATTTTAPGDVSGTTTTPERPATTVRAGGGGPASTAAPTPTAAPVTPPPATAPPGPVALTPAAPGTYRYSTSGAITGSISATFPAVTTNVVDPPAGVRQRSTRDLRDPSGNGSTAEYTFEYRADGVYLASLRFVVTFGGVPYPLDLTPPAPLLFLATGAAPGASRTLAIPLGTGGSATVVVDVLGTETVSVGGRGIDTLVVRSAATLPPGDVSGTQSLTVNLDRGSRLWVKERGTGDASAAGGLFTLRTQYEATIQSLTPG